MIREIKAVVVECDQCGTELVLPYRLRQVAMIYQAMRAEGWILAALLLENDETKAAHYCDQECYEYELRMGGVERSTTF